MSLFTLHINHWFSSLFLRSMLLPVFRPALIAPRYRDGGQARLPIGAAIPTLIAALVLTGCMTAPSRPRILPAPPPAAVAPLTPDVAVTPSILTPIPPSVATTAAGRPELTLNATGQMLAFTDRVRLLTSAELGAEMARIGDPGDSAPAQMHLAIALAATRVPADLARALGLLQRVIASQANDAAPIQPLARALAARYLEQRRIEDDRDRQVQQLREAQRRIDQLNDRLEALRAIERSVTRPTNNHPAVIAPAPVSNGAKPGS